MWEICLRWKDVVLVPQEAGKDCLSISSIFLPLFWSYTNTFQRTAMQLKKNFHTETNCSGILQNENIYANSNLSCFYSSHIMEEFSVSVWGLFPLLIQLLLDLIVFCSFPWQLSDARNTKTWKLEFSVSLKDVERGIWHKQGKNSKVLNKKDNPKIHHTKLVL